MPLSLYFSFIESRNYELNFDNHLPIVAIKWRGVTNRNITDWFLAVAHFSINSSSALTILKLRLEYRISDQCTSTDINIYGSAKFTPCHVWKFEFKFFSVSHNNNYSSLQTNIGSTGTITLDHDGMCPHSTFGMYQIYISMQQRPWMHRGSRGEFMGAYQKILVVHRKTRYGK